MSIKKCKSKFSHSFPGETLDFHFDNMLSDFKFDYNAFCATKKKRGCFLWILKGFFIHEASR